jgi:UrcA family protein
VAGTIHEEFRMSRSLPTVILSAAALLAAAAAPAFAQLIEDPESRVVTYGELDLDSPEGADTLIRRLNDASESVCARRDGRRPVRQATRDRWCEYETTEVAVSDVGHPYVSGRYFGTGVVEDDAAYYDPRLDPASPDYDPTLDPNSPSYIPPN